jgi:exo-beta-1,3-glucanase (GH17 family)
MRNIVLALLILLLGVEIPRLSKAEENNPPTVVIDSPKKGDKFVPGQEIKFSGRAVDLEDGELQGESIIWISDIDGNIGSGLSFTTQKLSPGIHLIQMRATDSRGKESIKIVLIRVQKGEGTEVKIVTPKPLPSPHGVNPVSPKAVPAPTKAGPHKAVTPRPSPSSSKAELFKPWGVDYGPHRENENPNKGVFPLPGEVQEDIDNHIIPLTSRVRIYGITDVGYQIPSMLGKAGIECWPGAWVSKYPTETRKEINALIGIGKAKLGNVKVLVVGNEVILRKDMTSDELVALLMEVKRETGLPVTTADTWDSWFTNPRIAVEVDYILVHIHPYWEGIDIKDAASYVVSKWKELKKAYPGKEVVIGETGWPSRGETVGKAVPSEENQAKFLREFSLLASKEGIKYFYFEVFDEPWKASDEGGVGASWGVYNSDGSPKTMVRNVLPPTTRKTFKREGRKLLKAKAALPLAVYTEADSDSNAFQPSGWMGNLKWLGLDKACTVLPHSGQTCTLVSFKPTSGFYSDSWAGIYWQYPINNWGEYPGYEVTGVRHLSFWVRGDKGGEKVEFKVGGIASPGKQNKDSFGPVSGGILTISNTWTYYTIDLKGQDLSSLIGGFCCVFTMANNPNGCTIYLDDVVLEGDAVPTPKPTATAAGA